MLKEKKVMNLQHIVHHDVCPLIWSYLDLYNSDWGETKSKGNLTERA